MSRANVQALNDVAATLASQSATAQKPEEQRQAQRQLQQLGPTLVSLAVSAPDAATKAQAASSLEKTPVDRTKVEQAVANVTANLSSDEQSTITPRIYFRIDDEKQRSRAEEFKQALIKEGNLVPGIENARGASGASPDKVEVRYFAPESKTRAESILSVLKAKGVNAQITLAGPSSNDLSNSPNVKTEFEIVAGKNSF